MKTIYKALFSSLAVLGLALGGLQTANARDTRILDIATTQAGIYRITYEDLLAQGIDLGGLRTARFGITEGATTIPRRAKGGRFTQGSFIEFVVPEVNESRYSDERVFTLHYKGPRKEVQKTRLRADRRAPSADSYLAQVRLEEQNTFRMTVPDANDPWAMANLFNSPGRVKQLDYSIELPGLLANGTAQIKADLYGNTAFPESPDHHVELLVSGAEVAESHFDGFVSASVEAQVPASELAESGAAISLRQPGELNTPYDWVILDGITVSYPKALSGQSNAIAFSSESIDSSFSQVQVSGFTGVKSDLSVYQVLGGEVSHASGVRKLGDESGFSAQFKIEPQAQYFIANGQSALSGEIRNVVDLADIESGQAEYLIITHSQFNDESLQTLVNLRSAQYSVKVVEVEQIYANPSFGKGVVDADAISAYIKYAVENLDTQMVLLVGDDSYDYKGYLPDSQVSYIPTRYAETYTNVPISQTVTDSEYGDLDGDDLEEIPVARFPVSTNQQLADIVLKIMKYEQREYTNNSVVIADNVDAGNSYSFTPDAENIIAQMPFDWQANATRAFMEQDGSALARTKLIDSINSGVALTSYIGHTAYQYWSFSSPRLLHLSDIQNLTNVDYPTVVTQWGCWNSNFADPKVPSIGEQFLLSDRGAATVLGTTSLTTASTEKILGSYVYQHMLQPGMAIGPALVAAKKQLRDGHRIPMKAILKSMQILGDPGLVVNP